MIKLNTKKTTGHQLHAIIKKALKVSGCSIVRFMSQSQLSRMDYFRWSSGAAKAPRRESVLRVARGLRWLGFEVEVTDVR